MFLPSDGLCMRELLRQLSPNCVGVQGFDAAGLDRIYDHPAAGDAEHQMRAILKDARMRNRRGPFARAQRCVHPRT